MGGRPCETGPEVATLLGYGMTPDEIVASLGVKPESIARGLQRAGLHHLAHPFHRLAWEALTPAERARKNRVRQQRRRRAAA